MNKISSILEYIIKKINEIDDDVNDVDYDVDDVYLTLSLFF